jgi:hypothetical protein
MNPWKSTIFEVLFGLILPDFRKSVNFLRFMRFVSLSFWQEQHANENRRGVLVEKYWQETSEVFGRKPAPMPVCPPE